MKKNRQLTIITLLVISMVLSVASAEKQRKYIFQVTGDYMIEQMRGGTDGTKVVKAWGIAKDAKKAIAKAKENAIAALLFTGYEANTKSTIMATKVPAICGKNAIDLFYENPDFFEDFFTGGEYLNYVREVNSAFPTGENNINTPDGRRVGILLIVEYKALLQYMRERGFAQNLGDAF